MCLWSVVLTSAVCVRVCVCVCACPCNLLQAETGKCKFKMLGSVIFLGLIAVQHVL